MKWWLSLQNWLIIKLVGKRSVMINMHIEGIVAVDTFKHALITGCSFSDYKGSGVGVRWKM